MVLGLGWVANGSWDSTGLLARSHYISSWSFGEAHAPNLGLFHHFTAQEKVPIFDYRALSVKTCSMPDI
ncbi:hypothetical protein GBA52_008221 [Prunus armeniaca]|nr:hypothetical protein GBA52_008221 [Prunus armeniaca]